MSDSPLRRITPALVLGAIALGSEALPGVLGQIALYPMLGAFPGLALAWLLLPRASLTTRWVVGLCLAPLLSSIFGWALLAGGVAPALATRALGAASWALWLALCLRPEAAADGEPGERAPASGAIWVLALGLGIAIAIPHFLNPWMLVKSDAWLHSGIVYQILERGMPPEDPRFAGLHLNYVWFFNLYVGLLCSVHDGNPFVFFTTLNVVDVMLTAWLAWLLGWTVWRTREAALGTALLTCFGFNALSWLLWPLSLLRVWSRHAPWSEALAMTRPHFASWRIMSDLSPPYGVIQNFVDKFVTGTSINYAWLLMSLSLWSLVRIARGRRLDAWLILALATAGMQLWHGVVGLSVAPVLLCAFATALVLRAFWKWLPSTARILEAASAVAAGFLATAPYTLAISKGWDAKQSGLVVAPVHLDYIYLLSATLACAFATWFAWKPMQAALAEKRGELVLLGIYAVGMALFALIIQLPNHNEVKFVFEAFIPFACFGGVAFLPALRALRVRAGAVAVVLLAVLLAVPHVLTLVAFTLDPERRTSPAMNPVAGENAAYAWIAGHTPPRAVFVDDRFRDLVMVRARRQMYLGSDSGPERAAFPLRQVVERRAVMADLYGAGRNLDGDVAALAVLGRPVCVVVSGRDTPRGGAALATRPDLFAPLYDRDGFVIYAVSLPNAPHAPGDLRP